MLCFKSLSEMYCPLCASKYALESINDALRMELCPWGIHMVMVAPSSMRTPAVDKLVQESEAMLKTFPPEGARRYAVCRHAYLSTPLSVSSLSLPWAARPNHSM